MPSLLDMNNMENQPEDQSFEALLQSRMEGAMVPQQLSEEEASVSDPQWLKPAPLGMSEVQARGFLEALTRVWRTDNPAEENNYTRIEETSEFISLKHESPHLDRFPALFYNKANQEMHCLLNMGALVRSQACWSQADNASVQWLHQQVAAAYRQENLLPQERTSARVDVSEQVAEIVNRWRSHKNPLPSMDKLPSQTQSPRLPRPKL